MSIRWINFIFRIGEGDEGFSSMAQELEMKFLDIDPDMVRTSLTGIGASCLHESFLMKRWTFHPRVKEKSEWFRIREEYERITLTYKCHHMDTIDGLEECEVEISDFDTGSEILEKAGLIKTSYQENFRETWHLDDVDICIDIWPGLPPYIEIEGPTPHVIHRIAQKLGFSLEDAFYGGTEALYETYLSIPREDLIQYPRITFDMPPLPSIHEK